MKENSGAMRTAVARGIVERLAERAADAPDVPALVAFDEAGGENKLNWRELQSSVLEHSAILARRTDRLSDSVVYLQATADLHSAVVILSCLCSGIPVLALTPKATPAEVEDILASVRSGYGEPVHESAAFGSDLDELKVPSGAVPPGRTRPLYLLTSGGSTGTPKVMPHWGIFGSAVNAVPNLLFAKSRWQVEQRQLIVSSLYHFVSFSSLIEGVLGANTTVLQRRVDPAMTLDLIDAQSIEWMLTTPTHMQEILDAPGVTSARLSSIRGILHTAGFCPPDLKREWLRLLSPHRIFEMYGATEGIGVTFAGGVEWLEHPGTVGRGFLTRVQVCDENGIPHPPGEVGRVYMRKFGVTPDQQSGRSWLKRLPGGFQSLGDLGWMDEGGYLFLVGREDDRVTVRGSDVFPAKVDMVLRSYPGVKDASMFIVDSPGAESELRGCVVPRAGISLDPERVREFCSARLSAEERPTSIDLLRKLPRTDMGKLRRRISLRELRSLQ